MELKLYTPDEVAQITHIASATLAVWRSKGKGPRYIKLGSKVMYRNTDIDEWLEKVTVIPVLER